MTVIEVRSETRNRVYVRAFDHDEARRLRSEEGWTYPAIAELMGVSVTAIKYACDPDKRAKMRRRSLARYYRNKPECIEEGCTNRVSLSHAGNSGRCQACGYRLSCIGDERDGELRCTKCGEWKPDDDFREEKRPSRRGRTCWCRACESRARRAHRKANVVQAKESGLVAKRIKRGVSPVAKFTVLFKSEDGWQEKATVEAPTRERAIEYVADAEGIWAAVAAGQLREFPVGRVQAFKIATNGTGPGT